jgi:glutamine cyclotransferase
LEFIDGEIWANVWQTDWILRINPSTGQVTSFLDLKGILAPSDKTGGEDVLNGIAYDAERKRIFVTGKLWPRIFEIKLKS